MPHFTVFTPSHYPSFLSEAYQSLRDQTDPDWEWVVVPNGPDADAVAAVALAVHDSRVRVVPPPPYVPKTIGGLKQFAAWQGEGDLLLELDHDDWLDPNCLAQVYAAWRDSRAGFLYSEALGLRADGSAESYSPEWGWTTRPHVYRGVQYAVPVTFPVTARSLAEIYWSPNHVRVWERDVYRGLGGHDHILAVGDDHDLLCRTYLAGVDFHKVDDVLYYWRCHPGSTCKQRQEEVARQVTRNTNRYLHQLVLEWCRRERLDALDLGGAHGCPRDKGFRSVDRHSADVIADVTVDIPVPAGSVGCFRAADFMEHIDRPHVVPLMNRLYDKLADGGWLISSTPSVTDQHGRVGRGAWQDPTHLSYWSENNWFYFTDRHYARYVPEITCRFQAVRLWTDYPSPDHARLFIPYVHADLLAVKSARPPGRLLI